MITPEQWGPPLWSLLHEFAVDVDAEKVVAAHCYGGARVDLEDAFDHMVNTLPAVLPCDKCAKSFSKILRGRPRHGNEAATVYLGDLHDRVNAKLKKTKKQLLYGGHSRGKSLMGVGGAENDHDNDICALLHRLATTPLTPGGGQAEAREAFFASMEHLLRSRGDDRFFT